MAAFLPSLRLASFCSQQTRLSRQCIRHKQSALKGGTNRLVRSVRVLAEKGNSHAGHAVLHDFCMTIPYGGIAMLSGLVAFVFKATSVGIQLAGAGAVVSLCSVLSLRSWRAGGASTPYTLVSGGMAGWVAYQMWQRVAASIAPVPSGILLALSAALAAFCVYNMVAGGNPPPSQKQA